MQEKRKFYGIDATGLTEEEIQAELEKKKQKREKKKEKPPRKTK